MNNPSFSISSVVYQSAWPIARLKSCLESNDGGIWGEDPSGVDDTIVLRSTEQTMDGKWIFADPARRQLGKAERKKWSLKNGDLLVTKSSGSDLHIGKTTLVTEEIAAQECCYSNFMQRLRVNSKTEARFVYWILNSSFARSQMAFVSNSTSGLGNLSASLLGSLQVFVPQLDVQKAVSEFLDRKTAEADALVAKYERLIELLEEKRVALITQAVTKGLDPTGPMKDSGVEWIGEIPEHWEIRPLKHLFRFKKGKNAQRLTSEFIQKNPGNYPVYSGQTENNGIMGSINTFDYAVDEVLFSTTVGAKVMTPLTIRGKFSLSQNCLIGIPKKKSTATDFFYYALHPLFSFQRASIPDHMQPSLRVSDIANFSTMCPSEQEQKTIVDYLKESDVRNDAVINRALQAISLIREKCSAMITAAVTGQIDVVKYQSREVEVVA